jgi:hypothetical protein
MSNYTGSVPDTAPRRLDWLEHAACRDDADIFFDAQFAHEARTMCVVHCPVRAHCLADVMNREQGKTEHTRDDGIFAGLDRRQRWRLDPTAPGRGDTGAASDSGQLTCGTAEALEHHLAQGELVDGECWSGELRRHHGKRRHRGTDSEPEPLAVQEPEPESGVPDAGCAPEESPAPASQAPVPNSRPRPSGRTPHERRIYRLWTQGLSDLDIARRMAVSVPSVRRVRDQLGLIPNLHTGRAAS